MAVRLDLCVRGDVHHASADLPHSDLTRSSWQGFDRAVKLDEVSARPAHGFDIDLFCVNRAVHALGALDFHDEADCGGGGVRIDFGGGGDIDFAPAH